MKKSDCDAIFQIYVPNDGYEESYEIMIKTKTPELMKRISEQIAVLN